MYPWLHTDECNNVVYTVYSRTGIGPSTWQIGHSWNLNYPIELSTMVIKILCMISWVIHNSRDNILPPLCFMDNSIMYIRVYSLQLYVFYIFLITCMYDQCNRQPFLSLGLFEWHIDIYHISSHI